MFYIGEIMIVEMDAREGSVYIMFWGSQSLRNNVCFLSKKKIPRLLLFNIRSHLSKELVTI